MSKIAPALAAGCTAVLKAPLEAPLDAYLLAEIVAEAGLPPGVLNIVPAGVDGGEHLVSHPGVDTVAFTGSTPVGRKIAVACGALLRPVTLELGGKSAAIVLDDADLDVLAGGLELASFLNNGEACIAQTRILASRNRYDEVVDAWRRWPRAHGRRPQRSEHRHRPAGHARQQRPGRELHRPRSAGGRQDRDRRRGDRPVRTPACTSSRRCSAASTTTCASPGRRSSARSSSVIPYDDEDDAVRIANDSDYGLAGSVWTADVDHGLDVARRVRTGTYGINTYLMDFVAPFGGYKAGGLGREFGPEGLAEYTEIKSIYTPLPEG